MKKLNNQFYGSYVGRMNYGGAKFYRFALFPLMLLMLLFVPTRMVAQTDYDTSVTFSALAGSPEGMSEAENFKKLFDGKKTINDFSKWCCSFYGRAYVIFEASKAGVPVGYTITTGNDNETWGGRNPLSWKLYGNNTGSDDAWELIDEVSEDKVLKDKNYASYEFTCKCSTSYQYFKWEISAIHSGRTLQVGEFKLKLQTCSHKNTDGSDALGEVIENVEPTCTEHGYTTHKCSLCNSIVKVYKDDVLKPHTLTHHALKDATCTEAGNIEYWQCSVCNKLFSDEATTKEFTDAASLVIPAKGHTFDREGNCTVCHYKDSRYALFNLEGITNVTITDNDSYPWKMLDLNADGMSNVSSYFTAESKGLMSNNYGKGHSTSEIIVKFNVEKPILFSFKYLISAKNSNDVFITLNGKLLDEIKGTEQKVYKSILNKGEYTLRLSYNIFDFVGDGNKGADRAFIYDLNTATTISDYVAELDATNTTLTFKKITSDNLESIDLSRLVIVNDEPMVKDMYDIETTNIKNIVFDESFKTYAPTSLEHFFAGCSTLETISGLEYLNTEKVTDMSSMFDGCQKLSSLDLSKFNTEKVTNMSGMFYGCQKLSSLDLSKFNTEKVTDMRGMFEDCQELSSLDLSKFNTKEVKYMRSMFYGCQKLSSLDLSKFNTEKVTDMRDMFWGCSALTSLDLSNFNTEKVESMMGMFFSCSALTSLDLSNFNTERVESMSSMFSGCSTLQTIFASDKFFTDQVFGGSDMFLDCTNLKGFIDYIPDSDRDNIEYANYKTGYFTKLVGKNGEKKIGATGETLATENLVLDDGKDFVAYDQFAAKKASYSRDIPEGSTWGTLCLPFAIVQSQETECKFYRLTGIDNDNECITLESCEEGIIPAGTPVLFKMNENEQTLSISVQNAGIVKEPVAGTNVTKPEAETASDVNLVGSFTKIGGKDNKGLDKNDYIIGKNKFWRVSDLDDGNRVGIKPMRAYIHPAYEYLARAAMLSIGKGDGTTAIDNLNAISNDANAEYYDANGRRTNGLQKGLNIVKRGSKTYKIMVK